MKNGKKILFGLIGALMMSALVLAACEIGEYESDSTNSGVVTHTVIKLETGKKVTKTETSTPVGGGTASTVTYSGTYEIKGQIITATITSYTPDGGSSTTLDPAQVEKYRLEGKSLISVQYTKKSVDNEAVIELELADDLSAEELEALGL